MWLDFFIPPIMQSVPWYAFPFVGLALLFVFFCLVVAVKFAIIRNGWTDNKIARVVFYVLGGRFLYLDAAALYVCWSPLALHNPFSLPDVDRTITAHANALIKRCTVTRDGNLYPDSSLNWRLRWATKFALFTCRHLNNIEPKHCRAYRKA